MSFLTWLAGRILYQKHYHVVMSMFFLSGSICQMYLTQSYTLPVLDTMFVRKRFQREDFALQMLEDYVDSFTEETLGLRYPLSPRMHAGNLLPGFSRSLI